MAIHWILALLMVAPVLGAATYHVDFAGGKDLADGLSPATAFQHCPGDAQATATAAATVLAPGDRIRFKGGVTYAGSIAVKSSGSADAPIIFAGNRDGTYGTGPAILTGGELVTGWRRCASVQEARGNPRWAEIWLADIPAPKSWKDVNPCDGDGPLIKSQSPNPADPFWQERTSGFWVAQTQLVSRNPVRVHLEPGTRQNNQRPISLLLVPGSKTTAVVEPLPGAAFTFTLTEATSITAVGIAPQPKYPAPKTVAFSADGKEILRVDLKKDEKDLQRFDLPAPVSLTRLTVSLISAYPDEKDYAAIRQVVALRSDGSDCLSAPGLEGMLLTDPEHLTGTTADAYDGMTVTVHAANNNLFNLPVRSFDPATKTLIVGDLDQKQYAKTTYCLFNSVRLIDLPGEYSVEVTEDPKVARLFLLPRAAGKTAPEVIRSERTTGFSLEQVSHVRVEGFSIRQQNKAGVSARGPGSGLVIAGCELAWIQGGPAVSGSHVDAMVVEDCHIHDNPGHTKGVVLHTCTKSTVRRCRLIRNTSTALDFYTCSDSSMIANVVEENLGQHANGLTLYVGCKDILVEGNRVRNGNCALTFQEGENLMFRNNLLDGNGRTTVIGIWPAQPLKNVQFLHNTIVGSSPDSDWTVGMFTNSKKIDGLIVRNNIIDGLFSDGNKIFRAGTFSNNLYTRVGADQKDGLLGSDELVETDLAKVFVDAATGDYRLRAGSPGIGAGCRVDVPTDINGDGRAETDHPDIGAFPRAP